MYLRESLSNYIEDNDICEAICLKLEREDYENETEFIDELDEEEVNYLNVVLEKEINYAESAEDEVRVNKLNEVYQLLF